MLRIFGSSSSNVVFSSDSISISAIVYVHHRRHQRTFVIVFFIFLVVLFIVCFPLYKVVVRLPEVFVWSTAHRCASRTPNIWSLACFSFWLCFSGMFICFLFLLGGPCYYRMNYDYNSQQYLSVMVDPPLHFCFISFFSCQHSPPFYRPRCSSTGPHGRRVKSRAPLAWWRQAGRTWRLVTLVLVSVGPWLAAAQALCAPGSAPSGPGGVCVACVAGSFCPDGRTLLPCPPGTVVLRFFCVLVC